MTEHEVTQNHLAALIAGSLSSAEATKVRGHIAVCAECTRQRDALIAMAKTVRNLPHPELTGAQLGRLAALARARRDEVMEQRQQRWVITALAVYAWVMFLCSLLLLTPLNHALEKQFGWPPVVSGLTTLILWGTFCWTISFGLVPLLHLHKIHRQEKRL
ncbi:MAG: anti-sigma factor family protein [Terriglobia bacterium]